MSYERLFQKGKIGRLTIKNRGVMVPMSTEFADHDGTASDRLIAYYEARAKGGVGLIINEYTGVDDVDSIPSNYNLRAARDYHIAALERLTTAVHRHDCKIFCQIHHGGATSKPALSGRQSIAPSDIPAAPGAPAPRPMTMEEIKAVQQKFIDAAVRCKRAGYDGVELHGAHSYLIGQFFSPYYNKREDDYGGSLENRMRFLDEIIAGIRKALPGYPLTVRICGDEMTPSIPGTLTLEDGLMIGQHLEAQGIDAINISNGNGLNANANCDPYSYQPGWKKHVAKAFHDRLSIPVIATNTIKNPAFAEQMLEEGVCDFVGLGRSQFADPEFMNKARTGREDEIRQCIGCMYCRERLIPLSLPLACAINPRMGQESLPTPPKNGENRPVAVIGGGPAGMQAALTLSERGFSVTLFEKDASLGGTLNLAAKPRFKEKIGVLVQTMARQLDLAGVTVRLNTEATPELLEALSPVGVIVASGAKPIVPKLPGIESPKVSTAEAVLRGEAAPTGRIAVIGTGLTGLETAELLGEQGHAITLIEMQPAVGPGLFAVLLNDIMGRIKAFSPTVLTSHQLIGVTDDGVLLKKLDDGSTVSVAADSVVLSLGVSPDPTAVERFEAAYENTRAAGDAAAAGRIYQAVKGGFDLASTLLAD